MGLIRGVARTAVVAGTASAVSGRVQRRQQGRWAAQDAQNAQPAYAEPQYAPPPPQYAAPPPAAPAGDDMDAKLAQLRELAGLRDQGVLTPAEFDAQKARILSA
ncbi:SHOCT domain-containing protein [Cellulosimicrobium sp. PMB13]|uniref:SHOCT domain-containing protein n=1 Tax=Cellulosimicrobium sp. PMB13 TaxID=3120158 RepID=UPI003F4C19CF